MNNVQTIFDEDGISVLCGEVEKGDYRIYLSLDGDYKGSGVAVYMKREQADQLIHALLWAQSYLKW